MKMPTLVYVTESYDTYRSSKIINMYEPLIEAVESKRESTKQSVTYSAIHLRTVDRQRQILDYVDYLNFSSPILSIAQQIGSRVLNPWMIFMIEREYVHLRFL
jgi:hypothetical protein